MLMPSPHRGGELLARQGRPPRHRTDRGTAMTTPQGRHDPRATTGPAQRHRDARGQPGTHPGGPLAAPMAPPSGIGPIYLPFFFLGYDPDPERTRHERASGGPAMAHAQTASAEPAPSTKPKPTSNASPPQAHGHGDPGGGTPHPPHGPTYRHRTICVSPEWNPPGGTAAPSHEASAGWLRLLSPTVFPSPHRGLRGFLR